MIVPLTREHYSVIRRGDHHWTCRVLGVIPDAPDGVLRNEVMLPGQDPEIVLLKELLFVPGDPLRPYKIVRASGLTVWFPKMPVVVRHLEPGDRVYRWDEPYWIELTKGELERAVLRVANAKPKPL